MGLGIVGVWRGGVGDRWDVEGAEQSSTFE